MDLPLEIILTIMLHLACGDLRAFRLVNRTCLMASHQAPQLDISLSPSHLRHWQKRMLSRMQGVERLNLDSVARAGQLQEVLQALPHHPPMITLWADTSVHFMDRRLIQAIETLRGSVDIELLGPAFYPYLPFSTTKSITDGPFPRLRIGCEDISYSPRRFNPAVVQLAIRSFEGHMMSPPHVQDLCCLEAFKPEHMPALRVLDITFCIFSTILLDFTGLDLSNLCTLTLQRVTLGGFGIGGLARAAPHLVHLHVSSTDTFPSFQLGAGVWPAMRTLTLEVENAGTGLMYCMGPRQYPGASAANECGRHCIRWLLPACLRCTAVWSDSSSFPVVQPTSRCYGCRGSSPPWISSASGRRSQRHRWHP